MENEIETSVQEYLAEHVLFSRTRQVDLSQEESLQERGLIDAQGVQDLAEFIHDRFSVVVGEQELTPDHFDSVRRIVEFIQNKVE